MNKLSETWYVDPGRIIAAVFFGLFCTGIILLVGWFAITANYNRREYVTQGDNTYLCEYKPDEVHCQLWTDPEVGGGWVSP